MPSAPRETRVRPPGAAGDADPYLLVVEDGSSRVVYLPVGRDLVVGRDADVDVPLDSDAASRRHARFAFDGVQVIVEDLGSRNGTTCNGEPVQGTRLLSTGDALAVGEAVLVLHAAPRVASAAILDGEALRRRLLSEVERATRFERPFAVLAVLGLPAAAPGKGALPVDAVTAAAHLRALDVIGPAGSGGGELVVLLPEARQAAALEVASRVLRALGRRGPVQVGVALCPDDGCEAEVLLQAARAAARAGDAARPAPVLAASVVGRIELGERVVLVADPAMQRLYQLIRRLAPSPLPVLISGETGAGKENAAFALHHFSPRAAGPFVAINCAALPEALVESELFGHEKGAFSGAVAAKPGRLESADGGTLFLDEVGELPLAVQAKLLRALDDKRVMRVGAVRDRPVDVRVVAATNRDLDAEVRAGRFRQDLYYRLGAATIVLPPLRDRPREVALLARRFLEVACEREGRPAPALSAAVLRALSAHAWPGNVRELKNTAEYLAATVDGGVVEPWHLPARVLGQAEPALPPEEPPPGEPQPDPEASAARFRPIADELRDLEQRRMEEALAATAGNQTRAAQLIAMPLRTFVLKVKQYGIVPRAR